MIFNLRVGSGSMIGFRRICMTMAQDTAAPKSIFLRILTGEWFADGAAGVGLHYEL